MGLRVRVPAMAVNTAARRGKCGSSMSGERVDVIEDTVTQPFHGLHHASGAYYDGK